MDSGAHSAASKAPNAFITSSTPTPTSHLGLPPHPPSTSNIPPPSSPSCANETEIAPSTTTTNTKKKKRRDVGKFQGYGTILLR